VSALETCAECGFDSRRWRTRDAGTLFHVLPQWWRLATADIARAVLNRRPAPTVWSALEYGGHSAVVIAMLRWAIEQVVSDPDVELPGGSGIPDAAGDDPPADLDRDAILADLEREGLAILDASRDPNDVVLALLLHAVHDATHHMMDVGRGLAAIGAGAAPHAGRVDQVNASSGGVPKLPTLGGAVDNGGLEGDRQADTKHHGRPFQALCLWSTEVLDELAALGHSIGPGSAGENITLSGIDWATLRPGTRLRVGSALAELSFPAVPCAKQSRWFSDGDFTRIAYENNPQWVRWYAWVREPGHVSPGDEVLVQP
jgi:MOSC domain-containing protein YiiM